MTKTPEIRRTCRLTRRGFLAGAMASSLLHSAAEAQQTEWKGDFDVARAGSVQAPEQPLLSQATLDGTQLASIRCDSLQSAGGWPVFSFSEPLRLGVKHPSVRSLRQRLTATRDLDTPLADGDVFDSYVQDAVRRFQQRHGLTPDGVVGETTANALNVPSTTRAAQLRQNVPRLAKARTDAARYVSINVPAAEIEAVENNRIASRHTAVVGQPNRQTPLLSSAIHEVNFNPFWTVPASIIRKDLIPLMREDPTYLVSKRIRIFDRSGSELDPGTIDWSGDEATSYMFRQDPGEQNALGQVRINFANDFQVYLHDTPQKNLFGNDERFLSSGCVRVQNVKQFIGWLLAETPGWTAGQIHATLNSGERLDVKLTRAIPVHFVYVTAWAGSDGTTQFRDDVYSFDFSGAQQVGQAG